MPYIGRNLGQGTRSRFLYTATAGQTTFSGSDTQSNTLAYADNNGVDCFQNGVLLKGGGADYTATSGTSVVLTTGASVSDVIEILVYDVFAIADHVKKSGDAMTGPLTNIDVNGTELILDADGDTSITADTDDTIDIKIAGSDVYQITATKIDLNGKELVLDADADTSITADTDDRVDIKVAGSDVVHVTSTGLGVGTNSLTGKLTVDGGFLEVDVSGTQAIRVGSTDHIVGGTDNDAVLQSNTSKNMRFLTGGSERMRIDSDGRLLVGTTSSGYSETGCRISSGGGIQNTVSGGQLLRLNRTTSTGNMVQFWYNGGEKGTITTNGSNVAYNTSSDYRLKENVVTDWDATTRLKQLKPSRFNFIADADTTVDGFLAHEVSSIVPEAITGEKDAVDLDGNIQPQAIDQSKLVPLLTKALQEAMARIETLEAKVTALEGKP